MFFEGPGLFIILLHLHFPPHVQVKRAARTELRKKYGPIDEARHMYAIQKFDHDVRGVGPGPPVVPKSGALSSRIQFAALQQPVSLPVLCSFAATASC